MEVRSVFIWKLTVWKTGRGHDTGRQQQRDNASIRTMGKTNPKTTVLMCPCLAAGVSSAPCAVPCRPRRG